MPAPSEEAMDGARRPIPRVVWLITALHGIVLVAYALLFPAFRGPDEHLHLDLSLALQREARYPAFDELRVAQPVLRSLDVVRWDERSKDLRAEEAAPRGERPSFSELGPWRPGLERNQLPQHPPLYYGLMAGGAAAMGVTAGGPDGPPFDDAVLGMRLLNVLLVLPLPILAFLAARGLGGPPALGITAALLPLTVPQLAHIGSVVNNDNLLILLIGALTVLLAAVARGRMTWGITVAAGLLAGAALFTKGFALFVPVWIGAAFLIGGRRAPWIALGRAGVAVGVAVAAGGWWWIRNVAVYGALQPGIKLLPRAEPGFTPDLLFLGRRFAAWLPERFWGWFGWFDVRIPTLVVIVATAVLIGALAVGVVRRRRDPALVVLLFPAAALLLLTMRLSYGGYAATGQTPAIQGRYLFPALAGMAAVAAAGMVSARRSWTRWIPVATLAAAGAMHLVAVRTILPAYWGPPGGDVPSRLEALIAWSPWPPAAVYAVVAAGIGTGIWLLVWLGRTALREPETA